MEQLAKYLDGLPNISGSESAVAEAIRVRGRAPVFWRDGAGDPFAGIDSAYAIALHMHQPLIPAGGDDLRTPQVEQMDLRAPASQQHPGIAPVDLALGARRMGLRH